MRSERLQQKDTWYKDRSILKESDSVYVAHQSNKSYIKDYSLKHKVSIEWDMNQDSINDRICLLKIDDYSVVVDVEELMKAVRFV